MKRSTTLIILIALLLLPFIAAAQGVVVSGKVIEMKTKKPVDMAVISLPNSELWAVANAEGEFVLKKVPKGQNTFVISCLGYVTTTLNVNIVRDTINLRFALREDNLTLESVVVTAKENSSAATTNRTINRTALDHMQVISVTDISGLLPGGTTRRGELATDGYTPFALRAASSKEEGNSSFGTAVEVDGVRLSTNASFGKTVGANVKNVSSTNIESVEVITGVPSVEYGDMTNGVIKINTRQGKTPYTATITTNPRQKQFSLSKGFELNKGRAGVLNVDAERTKAIANLASPYTSYVRNAATLKYSNTFNKSGAPIRFSMGVSGNIGGLDSKNDPDAFKDSYTRMNDNTIRGNFQFDYLLNKKWITGLELKGSIVYSDNTTETKANKSSASTIAAHHATTEGYFVSELYDQNPDAGVIMLQPGYWYQTSLVDSRPLDYNVQLKARWAKRFGHINNRVKLGAEFSGSKNLGQGQYYQDMRYAPTWREWRYDQIPAMNNLSLFAEENIMLPIGKTSLNLVAGVRSETTIVNNSQYGVVSALSPRFNAKYTIIDPSQRRRQKRAFVQGLSLRASYGTAVKLPSFSVLYPQPQYKDVQTFAPGTMADGTAYSAYHSLPVELIYNADLRWQRIHSAEVGADLSLRFVKISLAAFYSKTMDAYSTHTSYVPFSYNLTTQTHLNAVPEDKQIASANRQYSVDPKTGIVTVSDKTGEKASYEVGYNTRNTFAPNSSAFNLSSPSVRKGLEWILDFDQIKAIRTSIRLDGSYYTYRFVNQDIYQGTQTGANMTNGELYQYIGYYVGGDAAANGKQSRKLTTNLTFTTHIPKVRTVVSLRLESTLYDYSQSLSEWDSGTRSYLLADKNSFLPADGNIYGDYNYAVNYPLYYTSFSDPDTKIPFLEKFRWAKDNDPTLYSDLSQLVTKTNTGYFFRPARISAYMSINVSVTKEIGDMASISFYANNMTNTMAHVKQSQNDTDISIFNSSGYVPIFYYGLTLRLKF